MNNLVTMVEFYEILHQIKEKQQAKIEQELLELREKLKDKGSTFQANEIINYKQLNYYNLNKGRINNEKIRESCKAVWINHRNLKSIPNYLKQLNPIELFANNNQIDEIPTEICELTNLRLISFYKNKLNDFPMEICFLHNLRILDLGDNLIEDVPGEICLLSCLLELHLQSNLIKNLPEELYELKNLRVLKLETNYLTHMSPSIILLKKLVYLDITQNEIKELLPEVLEQFKSIENVFYDNDIVELTDIKSQVTLQHEPKPPLKPQNYQSNVLSQTYVNDNILNFKKLNQSIDGDSYDDVSWSSDDEFEDFVFSDYDEAEAPKNTSESDKSSQVPLLISSDSEADLTQPEIPENLLKNLKKSFPKSFAKLPDPYPNQKININSKQPSFPNYSAPLPPSCASSKLTQEDKNKIIYKKNILENINKFMRECDNPNGEKIDVIKEIKSNNIFSGITKTRIIEAFKNPNLFQHLKTHDNASHCIFNTEPFELLEHIYGVIESFETKSTLYEIINNQIMKIFEWSINEVNMLVSIIYKFSSDYYTSKTIAEFQDLFF